MKKFKHAMYALAMLAMLNACAAQSGSPPAQTQPPAQAVTGEVDTGPMLETMEGATEVTIPVREVKETQSASDNASTTQPATQPGSEQKQQDNVQTEPLAPPSEMEQPSTQSTEPAAQATEAPATVPEEPAPPATTPPATVPPTTTPPETVPPEPVPQETETVQTEPPATEVTEPDTVQIDTDAIEAYARSYASSLGFVIDTSLGTGNSGYYSPDYRPLCSTQDGYGVAAGMVAATKNQLNSRFSSEYSDVLVEEAYGIARCNCIVEYSHTDELGDWYYTYVFYG